jgi:hypothetical protein
VETRGRPDLQRSATVPVSRRFTIIPCTELFDKLYCLAKAPILFWGYWAAISALLSIDKRLLLIENQEKVTIFGVKYSHMDFLEKLLKIAATGNQARNIIKKCLIK